MCYYDLAISSSRLSNLSCKLLDHYLLSACMPHVTGHFCVCHVELWLLFHDFFPVPGYLFLDLDLGTWVPGEPGNQGTGSLVPPVRFPGTTGGTLGEPGNRFPGTGSLVPGNHRGTTGGTTREPGNWFPGTSSLVPPVWFPGTGSRFPGSRFRNDRFPKVLVPI